MRDLQEVCLTTHATVRDALEKLDANRTGIVLVLDEAERLQGAVTDGDVRRAILAHKPLETPITDIMSRRPITANPGDSLERLRDLMDTHRIRHIPVVDAQGIPTHLYELQDLVHRNETFPFAVILAGGEGRRLWPLTERLPKPMLKVGELPILENIIRRLVASGIPRLFLSVNYKAEVIEAHCGDGSQFGAQITYLRESQKLGTAGPLTLLPEIPSGPFLVVNGDIVTDYDFAHLYDHHWRHRCVMTIGTIVYKVQVPYGALKLAEHYVLGIEEKPVVRFACSAGIYAVNPEILASMPRNCPCDMTDLLDELVRSGLPVTAFAIHERWLDVGQMQDFVMAQEQVRAQHAPVGPGAVPQP